MYVSQNIPEGNVKKALVFQTCGAWRRRFGLDVLLLVWPCIDVGSCGQDFGW